MGRTCGSQSNPSTLTVSSDSSRGNWSFVFSNPIGKFRFLTYWLTEYPKMTYSGNFTLRKIFPTVETFYPRIWLKTPISDRLNIPTNSKQEKYPPFSKECSEADLDIWIKRDIIIQGLIYSDISLECGGKNYHVSVVSHT